MRIYRWLLRHPVWLLYWSEIKGVHSELRLKPIKRFTLFSFSTSIIGVAFLIRILPATVRFVIGSDDGLFLTLGQNLAAGRGYTGDGLTTQIDFPPGYPFFAAAIYALGGGLELPTKLNMLLIGALLPLSIYWLTYQLTDKKTALIAGLLTALHPALVLAQGNFESVAEQPYSLLLYTSWAILWWALTNRRLWAFALAGLLIGMAHLVRWEGIILGSMAAGLIVLALRRASVRPVLVFLAGLALFAAPYGLFLYRNTGSFLSPKTMLTQLHAAAIDATASDPYAFERSFFEHYETWLADPRYPPEIIQASRTAALQRYVGNLLYQIRLWFTSASIMTILWVVPFFIGLGALGRKETLFLLPLFIPLAAIPASVVDPRYFLIPLPVMMIFAARGWSWLGERLPSVRLPGLSRSKFARPGLPNPGQNGDLAIPLERKLDLLGLAKSVSLATLLLTATLTLFTIASLVGPFLYPRPTGYRAAGLALRNQISPDIRILARKRQIPFYAGGVWEWLPFADLDGVLAYAEAHNAEYFVVDQFTTPTLRPQLAYLLDPANAPDSLSPVYVDDKAGVVVYQINR